MTVIRWKPAQKAEKTKDTWFDNFDSRDLNSEKSLYEFEPYTNLVEKDEGYEISIELPGVKKEDVKISFLENVLTVKGEKRNEEKVSEKNYVRTERRFGSFERSFRLPSEVDINQNKASFLNGILTIELAKKEEVKPKEISIKIK